MSYWMCRENRLVWNCCRFQKDPTWSETGDRYLLKLFRDHLFHQVTEAGTPWVDLSHIVSCLNKVSICFCVCFFLYISCETCHVWSLLCSSAGCRSAREDQPGVSGWEERAGGDLLRPKALLWQHLPGTAGCRQRLAVAPLAGTGWDCLNPSTLHYSERRRAQLERSQRPNRSQLVTHLQSDTLSLKEVVLFCFFFS